MSYFTPATFRPPQIPPPSLPGSHMVNFGDFVVCFTFTLHFSTSVWSSDKGQSEVIGWVWPIVAAPGDNVVLPCHVEPSVNVERLTVEWSRPDLKPDPSDRLSQVGYVHVYRNRHEDPDMKLKLYDGRTQLFANGLKSGNISLKISNVSLEDRGQYRCFIPKLNSKVKASLVTLIIDPNFGKPPATTPPYLDDDHNVPDPMIETGVEGHESQRHFWIPFVIFCVLFILCGGILLKIRCQKVPEYPAPNIKTPV